jgi:hypothetical protein
MKSAFPVDKRSTLGSRHTISPDSGLIFGFLKRCLRPEGIVSNWLLRQDSSHGPSFNGRAQLGQTLDQARSCKPDLGRN